MIEALATIRRVLPELAGLGADGQWLAGALERWLDGANFEEALGLFGDWRGEDRRQRRDQLLRQLGELDGGSVHARATAISCDIRDYMATAWRYQRGLTTLPPSEAERRQLLHAILRLDSSPPTSIRQLATILSICNPERLPLQTLIGDCQPADHGPDKAA
jgi:hypothetical protein